MEQESERRQLGTCCVCEKPVYADQNPIIGDPACPLRHRGCWRPGIARHHSDA